MKRWEPAPLRTLGAAVWYGAATGLIGVMVYGAVSALYIIIRSSLQIVAMLSLAEGLLGT